MYSEHRAAVLRAVAAWLDREGVPHCPFVVTISCGEDRHRLSCSLWPEPAKEKPQSAAAPAGAFGKWLSPLEAKILAALASGDWSPTKVIAERIAEDPEGDIRAVLRNMVERELLESSQPRGFRVRGGSAWKGGTKVPEE